VFEGKIDQVVIEAAGEEVVDQDVLWEELMGNQ